MRAISTFRLTSPHSAWLTSAGFHAALLIVLALIVLPTSGSRVMHLLVAVDNGRDNENLSTLDEIAIEIAAVDDFDDIERPAPPPTSSLPLPVSSEPAVPTDVELPEIRAFDLAAVDARSLLAELDELTPRRRISKKAPRNLLEKQLTDLAVPQNASRTGSFTIFAEPPDPIDQQPYWLIIQLDLPPAKKMRKLDPLDVSGLLVGTDGFQMQIPSGPFFRLLVNGHPLQIPKPPQIQDRFVFADDRARWGIWVPGANKSVRDTIRVRSRSLNEQRQIELEF